MSRNPIIQLCHPALGLLLSLAVSAGAHVGDRVYPIAYLSDGMVERIDLEDGLVDEWEELIGEPTMTMLEFTEEEMGAKPDPSNLDFRIWLAWHDDPARFYVAFLGSDDDYKNDHDYNSESPASSAIILQDCIALALDGDHSGGAGCSSCSEEGWLDAHGNSQTYWAIARTASGPVVDLPFPRYYFPEQREEFAWVTLPPLAHGGGGVAGENPTISVIELYVTPLDSWAGQHNPEEIVVSDWAAGQFVGFAVGVADREKSGEHGVTWTPEAMGPSVPTEVTADNLPALDMAFLRADGYIDGILLGPERAGPGDSAVESGSWGRIKDGLVEEWEELIGEPSMTLLDFTDSFGNQELDPSDLDFRIWLAWHDDPARFYVAFVASDDVYQNTFDYANTSILLQDSIALVIDGDHGGGPGCSDCMLEEGVELEPNQIYQAIARTSSGPTVDDWFTRNATGEFAWTVLPPYGDGGGGVFGENPTISAIELYVTPFDRWAYDDIEGNVISDLTLLQALAKGVGG